MIGKSIRAISVWQPWASLIATGAKQFETRSWATSYRGLIAIQAAKRWTSEEYATTRYLKTNFGHILPDWPDMPLPLGAVVCVAQLVDVIPTEKALLSIDAAERAFGSYGNGRYAWELHVVEMFDNPIPATGAQGLWWWRWEGGR